MSELKSCPFCGGKAFVRYVMPCLAVQCEKCGASTAVFSDWYEMADGRQEAIEAWNRRVKDDTERKID